MTPRDRGAVLTTGANSGIGLATVVELARRGFRSIGSVRSQAKADVVHKAAANAGVSVAIPIASCSGTPTFVTIVRTRSIMREALPASADRSASKQTPASVMHFVP